MYTNFNDLNKAYGFDNPNRTRYDLSKEEQRAFVNDCYETYEHIGFADTFCTVYPEQRKYVGMKFSVLSRVKEYVEDKDNGVDLDSLPIWNIQFENGDTLNAYPEEICLDEQQFANRSEIKEPKDLVIVTISNSFNAEVVSLVFDDEKMACNYIKKDFENKKIIDTEENGWEIDEDFTYCNENRAVLSIVRGCSRKEITWTIATVIDKR